VQVYGRGIVAEVIGEDRQRQLRGTRAAIAPLEPGWAVIEEFEVQLERSGARRAVPTHLDRIGSRSVLARRFTINPVLVILSLVFWYWMWGVPGAVLSTPMLAITKIICDRVRPLMAFGHFIEG
jgi:hypothetical protein